MPRKKKGSRGWSPDPVWGEVVPEGVVHLRAFVVATKPDDALMLTPAEAQWFSSAFRKILAGEDAASALNLAGRQHQGRSATDAAGRARGFEMALRFEMSQRHRVTPKRAKAELKEKFGCSETQLKRHLKEYDSLIRIIFDLPEMAKVFVAANWNKRSFPSGLLVYKSTVQQSKN